MLMISTGQRAATASAAAVLPEAVGPTNAISGGPAGGESRGGVGRSGELSIGIGAGREAAKEEGVAKLSQSRRVDNAA